MMLRVLVLSLTLFTGFAQATVLQRPISLMTGTGELFGSLLLPKSDTPVPVVLIISGSGPTDRDGNNPDGGRNDSLKAGRTDENVPPQLQVIFRPSVQPYLISLFRQDPAAAFAKLKMPALIVQGTNDIQVGVGDARQLKNAKPDAQLAVIEGMNHVMRIVPKDVKQQLASYNDPQLPLAAELGSRVVDFIDGLQPR